MYGPWQAMSQSLEMVKKIKASYVEAARVLLPTGDNERLKVVMWECNRLWRAVFTLCPDKCAVRLLYSCLFDAVTCIALRHLTDTDISCLHNMVTLHVHCCKP